MSEVTEAPVKAEEPKAEPTLQNVFAADTMDALAGKVKAKAEAKAEARKVEAAKTETPVESVKVEEHKAEENKTEVKAEIKEEPKTNGKSEQPKEDAAITSPQPQWWESEQPAEQTKSEIKQDDTAKRLRELEEKAKLYDEIANDKLISAIHSAKKSGKDISSILNEIKPPSLDGKKPSDLWQMECEANGLSPEEIEVEMEKFNELSPLKQRKEAEAIKNQILERHQSTLSKYTADNIESSKALEVRNRKALELANAERTQFQEKIKDKDWMGIKMTPSEISKLDTFLDNDFSLVRKDGSLNYEMWAEVGHYVLNKKTIMQNAYNKGVTDAKHNLLLEMSRPNDGGKKFNSAPDVKPAQKQGEKAKAAIKSAFA